MGALSRLMELPAERPVAVLVVLALATLALGAGVEKLQIDSSIDSMIVEGDPDQRLFEAKKEIFGGDEIVSIAIPFGDALAPEALAAQRRIARAIEGLPGVADVDSLATTDDILGREDSLVVEALVPQDVDPERLDGPALARIRERVEANRIWPSLLISADHRVAAIQVRFDDFEGTDTDRTATLDLIGDIVREHIGDAPFHLAGHPYMKSEIARTIARDLAVLLPVALGVMALFLLLGIGSWIAAVMTLSCVIVAVVWMVGAMGWLGLPLTAVSNAAPTILLALATAHLMHVAAAYQAATVAGCGPREGVRRALARVRGPMAIAALTTAIGYASLAISKVPILRGFGIDLAIGVLAVFVLGSFGLPALLALTEPRPGQGAFGDGRRLGRLLFGIARVAARRPAAVLGLALVVFALAAISATGIRIDSSGPKKFARSSPFRTSAEFYRAHLSGDVVENVYLSGEPGEFQEPEFLARMLAFQEAAEALPQVDKTLSIADSLMLMNRALFGDDPREEKLPGSAAAVAQYMLLYSLSGDPREFDDLVRPDFSEVRILLKATVLSSEESAELRRRLQSLVAEHFPDEGRPRSVLSTEILLSRAADTISTEQVRGFAIALGLILALVTASFRSWAAGGLMLLPNGLPIVLNLGVMAALGVPLSDATSIISATALGIAVDSTVHLLAATRRAEADHGSRSGAVLEGLLTTGRPVLVTGIIVVTGFSVLMLSGFQYVAELGLFTALTMVYCLLADLFVLPAQLLVRRPRASGAGEPVVIELRGDVLPGLVADDGDPRLRVRLMRSHASARDASVSLSRVRWLESSRVWTGRLGEESAEQPSRLLVELGDDQRSTGT